MDQVDLVDLRLLGKLTGLAPRAGHFLIFFVLDHLVRVDAEFLQLRRNGGAQFGQIHHTQRRCLPAAGPVAYLHEVVHDRLADLHSRHGRVLAHFVQPVRVIPADAWFGFLAGDHVVSVLVQHQTVFHRAHQAGVKSDEIKLHAACFQRVVDPGQRHGLSLSVAFIVTVPAYASAAVIPEDQAHPVRLEILLAEFDKGSQRGRIRHAGIPRVIHQAGQAAVLDLIDLVDAAADHVVLPSAGAAGENDQVHLVADLRVQHFLQVAGRHAVLAFQVRAAHIHEDRHRILVASFDHGIFVPRSARNCRVSFLRVVLQRCRKVLLVIAVRSSCRSCRQICCIRSSGYAAAHQSAQHSREIIGGTACTPHKSAQQVHDGASAGSGPGLGL